MWLVPAPQVRISFQRANPTFGNFGDQKKIQHLPGCLKTMIEDEILPRARKDTSTVFRETVMTELSVLKVLDDYRCLATRLNKPPPLGSPATCCIALPDGHRSASVA